MTDKMAKSYFITVRFLQWQGRGLQLTENGLDYGNQLIRAHRLWETFLAQEFGLNEDQIHDDAEKYEHILSESLVDEVASHLGNPQLDPHGSPIPLRPKRSPKKGSKK